MPYRRSPNVQVSDKYCFRCQSVKPKTDFYRQTSNRDGYTSHCKECVKLGRKQSYLIKARIAEATQRLAQLGKLPPAFLPDIDLDEVTQ